MILFAKILLFVWALTFGFVLGTKGLSAACLVLLVAPFIILYTLLSVLWPLILAVAAIWGTYRIVLSIRENN